MNKRVFLSTMLALVFVLSSVGSALAGTVTSGSFSLSYPGYPLNGPALQSCEPREEPSANTITLSGVQDGQTAYVTFLYSNPFVTSFAPIILPTQIFAGTGAPLVIAIPYPTDTTSWPVFDNSTNERAIAVAAMVQIKSGTTVITKLISKQWWVRCKPPARPFAGCTPGYWRQDQHFDSWVATGFTPSDDFNTVFGVSASFDPHTLLDAVWLGGGGEFALARHAVAAILNASHPDVNYAYTEAEIIAGVQAAYASGDFEPFKTMLDFANNAGCTLN